jgi:hypothetical protein
VPSRSTTSRATLRRPVVCDRSPGTVGILERPTSEAFGCLDRSRPYNALVGKRSVERRLRKTSARLRELRSELVVIDEQLAHLIEDAEEKSLRALVAENPAAAIEHREAAGHSEAMAEHRRHVVAEIDTLDARQDELLDELRLL